MKPVTVLAPRDYNAAQHFIDRHLASGHGDALAYLDHRGRHSYAELADASARVGAALGRLGVEMEQRVLLCLLDTFDFPVVFWGALRIGAVPVPVNTLLTTEDYAFLLRDSRARVAVVSDALYPRLAPALAASPWLRAVIVVGSPSGGPDGGHPRLEALLATAGPAPLAPTCRDDVAFWLYSSGSTGKPKAAVHLHGSLVQTAMLYGEQVLGIRSDDLIFSAAKLFFAYGLGNAMTFPLHVGAAAVLLAERPTPAAVLRVLREHRPTLFGGVPTLFSALLSEPSLSATDGASLRCSISAGEGLPRHIGERWREQVGSDILDGLGSTEMLHIFLSNRPGQVRYGSTGRPVPGYEVRLLDDSGEPVSDGEEGSLWVRGPSCCAGYWNDRERSLQTFHGGWTRTGDRYVRDADGAYLYSGRADDMLKVGGIWVAPFEVESALLGHPAVLEAAVVGHEDEAGLIKPKAFVVLRETACASAALCMELQDFVKGHLAPYKYPRWIEFVAELPKTATGKIQRYRLRT